MFYQHKLGPPRRLLPAQVQRPIGAPTPEAPAFLGWDAGPLPPRPSLGCKLVQGEESRDGAEGGREEKREQGSSGMVMAKGGGSARIKGRKVRRWMCCSMG